MEHISRGILPAMEIAILVSDCSRRGVQAAGRIARLMEELNFLVLPSVLQPLCARLGLLSHEETGKSPHGGCSSSQGAEGSAELCSV